ncbi:formate dehydrogenase subunit alpha [Sesbania bispinosa]|nr:formate dehydrogenase subunit alpha [Sesbania bispinosa]
MALDEGRKREGGRRKEAIVCLPCARVHPYGIEEHVDGKVIGESDAREVKLDNGDLVV